MRNTKFLYFYFCCNSKQKKESSVPNFCCNDGLSLRMGSVGCLPANSELFILFAEISQILLKLSVIPSPFHVSGSAESVFNQTTQLIIAAEIN